MYGIFVNNDGVRYADAIVGGYKTIETRNRHMLRALVGKNVHIVSTSRKHKPMVIGIVGIVSAEFCPADKFDEFRDQTLIPPGSRFDANTRGKWMYHLTNPIPIDPYPLPADAVRHGISWCEF